MSGRCRWLIEERPPERRSAGDAAGAPTTRSQPSQPLEQSDPQRPWERWTDGAPGPWNMGVDEALFETAARTGLVTLRFYTWSGPWLSLGYAQSPDPRIVRECRSAGVGLVRRSTGGRAVLHGRDLTYSIAAPASAAPPGLRGAYGRIAEALVEGLRELGVHAERSPAQPPGAGPGRGAGGAPYDCFTDPAGDEICLGGRKLAGSAQRRGAGAFLQHGSIRLQPDPVEATRAAGLGSGGATSLAEQGHPIAPDTLGDALARAFARVLGIELERSALADEERVLATARGEEPAPPTLMSRPTPGP